MIIVEINKVLIGLLTFFNNKKKKWKKEKNEKIKEDIIKAIKDEKTTVTNLLQKLLKDQVTTLQAKIDLFKSKENYNKEDIDKHNNEVNEIQRKITFKYIIFDRYLIYYIIKF